MFVQISVNREVGYLQEHFPFCVSNSDFQSDLQIATSLTCNLKIADDREELSVTGNAMILH